MSDFSRLKERVDELEKNVEEVEQKAARLADWASTHQSYREVLNARAPSTAMIVGEKVDTLRKAWNSFCFVSNGVIRPQQLEQLTNAIIAICGRTS